MLDVQAAGSRAARIAAGLGFIASTEPREPVGLLGWLIQLGALGLLAWYFLRVEPQQRREERETRRKELELLLRLREQDRDKRP